MITTTNSTEGGTQTETYKVLLCSPSLIVGLQKQSVSLQKLTFSSPSLAAILGDFLILVALNKESSLHSSSKLLYRCLTTTDLLVGLITQPLAAAY